MTCAGNKTLTSPPLTHFRVAKKFETSADILNIKKTDLNVLMPWTATAIGEEFFPFFIQRKPEIYHYVDKLACSCTSLFSAAKKSN